jgi:hypothetical protein
MSVPMAIRSSAGDEPGDDPRVPATMARTAQRYAGGIAESVAELADLQLVQSADVTIRVTRLRRCSQPRPSPRAAGRLELAAGRCWSP